MLKRNMPSYTISPVFSMNHRIDRQLTQIQYRLLPLPDYYHSCLAINTGL